MHDINMPRIEFDKLRILDFYFVFPHLAENIKFPQDIRGIRKVFQKAPIAYERIPEPVRVFDSMLTIQSMAVHAMIGSGLLLADVFSSSGHIQLSAKGFDIARHLTKQHTDRDSQWYLAITTHLARLELLGPQGLKARSGLAEYRYDLA